MPEGVRGYPAWEGGLSGAPPLGAIVEDTWRRTWRSTWGMLTLVLVFGYAVLYIGSLYTASQGGGGQVHTTDRLVGFLAFVTWGGLAIAAVAGAPSLVSDREAGALELYLTRGVTRSQYLVGKALSVLGLTFACVAGPGALYYATSWFVFDTHPEGWAWSILGVLGFGLLAAVVITTLALGLSAALGSARASVLVLLGAFAVLDVLVGDILMLITDNAAMEVASPISALHQQATWLFQVDAPFDFPTWWAGITLALAVAIGLGLLARYRPRVRGERA